MKRSVRTEASGIRVGIVVDGAKRHDMKLVRATLQSVPSRVQQKRQVNLANGAGIEAPQEQGLCLDAGYDYDAVRQVAAEFGYTTHIRGPGEEKQAKEARARKHDAGSLSARIRGSGAFVACWCAGRRRPPTTWLCCTLPAL